MTVVGVRMRTSDRDRAVRQWSALLEGELSEEPGELRFRWPESGMRIAVSVESGAQDASDSIELSADRSLQLPGGPHPVLGASFRQIASD